MKKAIAVFLSAVLIVTMLSGCGMFFNDDLFNEFLDSSNNGYDYNYGSGGDHSAIISSNMSGESLREHFTEIKGDGSDVVTVMMYLCGSNLESENGMATADLREMLSANYSENVNIIVQTGGARKWQDSPIVDQRISGRRNQRYQVMENKLELVDDSLGSCDMTDPDTLTDFIKYCAENYPANRYMLILWNHGDGAVGGFGYDEHYESGAFTIDEMQRALYDSGIKFDFIGFDACLMSSMEVACVLYDYADYMIASEDYETGYGWEYRGWLNMLSKDPSTSTAELGKVIVEDFVEESGSDGGILAVLDLSYAKLVYTTWYDYAVANKQKLLSANFSWETENNSRQIDRTRFGGLLDSYLYSNESHIIDIVAIANTIYSEESDPLIAAIGNFITYCKASDGDSYMTGLAVTIPYGDAEMYRDLKKIFSNAGFEDEYIKFLSDFTSVSSSSDDDVWEDWYNEWNGWDDFDDIFGGYDWNDWDDWGSIFGDNWSGGWGADDWGYGDGGWSSDDYFDSYDDYDFGYWF